MIMQLTYFQTSVYLLEKVSGKIQFLAKNNFFPPHIKQLRILFSYKNKIINKQYNF